MRTTKVGPDLVDITRYNKFQLEVVWGLERSTQFCLIRFLNRATLLSLSAQRPSMGSAKLTCNI
jgi:hypothetical protein